MTRTTERKKTNFMVNYNILASLKEFIPNGQRSDFINDALEEAISKFKRKLAGRRMDERRKRLGLHISTGKLIKLKNEGRM